MAETGEGLFEPWAFIKCLLCASGQRASPLLSASLLLQLRVLDREERFLSSRPKARPRRGANAGSKIREGKRARIWQLEPPRLCVLSVCAKSWPARARFHLPRRRAPRGGGARLLQPISDAGASSCCYKGLGAAAARPRARSAQRGPEGGREALLLLRVLNCSQDVFQCY